LKLAFGSSRDAGKLEIYVMNADGSEQKRLTDNEVDDYGLAWSPDGLKLAFYRAGDNVGQHIYVMNANGTGVLRLTNNSPNELSVAWTR
jgi:TolB protein